MSNILTDSAHGMEKLPAERKVVYISAILGIILAVAWFVQRKGAGAATAGVSESQDTGTGDAGGGTDTYDRQAEIDAAKEVSLAALASDASLEFSIISNSLGHDMGISGGGKSGSGGISIGGISIGGGGSSTHNDQYDLTTSNDFSAGFAATGLDSNEFATLLQSSMALTNAAAASEKLTYDTSLTKVNAYKSQPKPANAPKGMHQEQGVNGQYYWVKDGQTIKAA